MLLFVIVEKAFCIIVVIDSMSTAEMREELAERVDENVDENGKHGFQFQVSRKPFRKLFC